TPVLAGRPPPGPVRPAPALNTSAPTAIRPKEEAMTSAVPTAAGTTTAREFRLNMCGPDVTLAYDTYVNSTADLGQVPAEHHGSAAAVIGGAHTRHIAAHELRKMGLNPVVYEADRIGGRLRTERMSEEPEGAVAEMGAMRFPPSSAAFSHYVDRVGLRTTPFPNPLSPAASSTVVDL